LLFGLKDLEIHKYSDDSEAIEIVKPERIAARQANQVVESFESLKEGVIELLITIQGRERILKVWHVPYPGEGSPLKRDFTDRSIRLFDGQTVPVLTDDLIIEIVRGDEFNKIIIPVFSPIEGHEIWIDNKLMERIPLGEDVLIPFLNCDKFMVKTLDRNGIYVISGEEMKEAYYDAPDQGLGDTVTKGTVKIGGITLYVFNPQTLSKLTPVSGGIQLPVYTDSYPRHYGEPKFPKSSPFAKVKGLPLTEAFELAVKHRTYFFVFKELKKGVREERLVEELFIPLAKESKLDEKTMVALWQMAFEFHFDWMLLPRQQWGKVPLNLRDIVIDFFLSTPKAINDYERRQLEIFTEDYWNFNDYSTTDSVGKTALQMILGKIGDTPAARHTAMFKFVKEYDHSATKFHEMTKTITK